MGNFTTAPARLLAMLSFGVMTATGVAPVVHAQSTTVTFNSLTESSPGSGTRYVGNCYAESGFLFTAVGLPCTGSAAQDAFVAGNANSPIFGGGTSPSLLLNSPTATVVNVSRANGAFFTFTSIQLSPFDGAATTVVFTGVRAAGNVSRTVTLNASQMGFMTFSFEEFFRDVSAVQIAATNQFGEPYVKFDSFAAMSPTVGVVPEPQTYLLMAAGMFGVAIIIVRKKVQS